MRNCAMTFERHEQSRPAEETTSRAFELPMTHELRLISNFANNASRNDSQQLVKSGVLPDVQLDAPSPLEKVAKSLADSVIGFDDWVQKQSGVLKHESQKAMHDLHNGFFGHGY